MAKEELECSFCGRKKSETNLLIAGLDAHICDRCIEQAYSIVVEESKTKLELVKKATRQLNEEIAIGIVINKTLKSTKDLSPEKLSYLKRLNLH